MHLSSIPIIINSRDRVSSLQRLVSWLLTSGYDNVHILDNDSTYEPLLDYYSTVSEDGVQIHLLGRNLLSKALWCWPEARNIITGPFVYTDADIVPAPSCPPDVIDILADISATYGEPYKIGLSLQIDDIPESYALRDWVIKWEKQFWQRPIGNWNGIPLYSAPIDTTFAYYSSFRPFQDTAIRTGPPCTALHLPWYIDSSKPSEEDQYYESRAVGGTHSWGIDRCYSRVVSRFMEEK